MFTMLTELSQLLGFPASPAHIFFTISHRNSELEPKGKGL